jgi:predicted alpha/beta-fold hydrolase
MTEVMVERYSEFPNLDAYLSGYAITGDVLTKLAVRSHAILAEDDPIIPVHDLQDLARNPYLEITTLPYGGHCGFMDSFNSESWADRQVARLMGL